MHLFSKHPRAAGGTGTVSELLARWFPLPQLLYPRSAGIDISDASIKWLALDNEKRERIVTWGEEALLDGVVSGGTVQNVEALASALVGVKSKLGGIMHAHAALPEEMAYVFSMQVPEDSNRKSILSTIEFELANRVPIPPREAIYDYDVIPSAGAEREIGVVVFPRVVVEGYAAAFRAAASSLCRMASLYCSLQATTFFLISSRCDWMRFMSRT